MTPTPQNGNGPTGREWGELLGGVNALRDEVRRLDRDVRASIQKADAAIQRADDAHNRVAVIRERIFFLGALVAIVSGLGGGVVNEHWSKIAMKETRSERPDAQPPESSNLAFDYCGRGNCRSSARRHFPERR